MRHGQVRLSDHFDYKRLLRFTQPSILTMIFASIYSIVDGYFVSNYAGAIPFSALNIIYPLLMIQGAAGFMFGSGGTALVSLRLGQEDKKAANEIFSLIIYSLITFGIITSVIGYIFAPTAARFLGATEELLPDSILYARINMLGMTPFMLQYLFQSFLITAERPQLGFINTFIAGMTNIILDYILVGVFRLGLAGAAWATVASQFMGGMIPLIFFMLPNKTVLRLGKTKWDGEAILKTCTNGSSEFLSNAAASVVSMLYNFQLLKYMGTNGVAAYGVIMYIEFIFSGIYYGYAMGVSPVIGYHYGAENKEELKNLFKRSIILMISFGVTLTLLSEISVEFLANIFVGYDKTLFDLTCKGMRIYNLCFLALGLNIFGSTLFTSLSNGLISAVLSATRSILLQISLVVFLPYIFGGDSIWAIEVVAELCTLLLTVYMIGRYKKTYEYY